jgi:hypothetical protein
LSRRWRRLREMAHRSLMPQVRHSVPRASASPANHSHPPSFSSRGRRSLRRS